METEELIKLVDGIYKNILEKFNPGARQMINAGKAYLKALHGAAAASRVYVDAITKLARQAQQGTWGSSSDIGSALIKVVEVYKEIQDQQMNILKAFYVDLLVPLETNLEKDTKVVQSEQKKFLQQHKQRAETYSKAAALMKKQRKKSKGTSKTGLAMDKELKNMQVLEEEKTKLDSFCEQSLKNAMTQERRRYGFVLERQCSLAKHYLSYYTQGVSVYQQNLEKWQEVAKTREYLPETVENIFTHKIKQVSIWQDDDLYSNPRSPNLEEDRISINSQLRKTKSMDASCLDIRSIEDAASSPVTTLNRAKSDHNLNSSFHNNQDLSTPTRRPRSVAVPNPSSVSQWETHLARAMYAYLSSGENQLSFLEGDIIALIGERTKGWQFGENLRTQCSGWFPMAYTELLDDSILSPKHRYEMNESHSGNITPIATSSSNTPYSTSGSQNTSNNNNLDSPTPRMFGDTLHIHRSSTNAKQIRRAIASNNIPPPALPAPVPTPSLPFEKSSLVQSHSTTFSSNRGNPDASVYSQTGIKTSTSNFNFVSSHPPTYPTHPINTRLDKPTGISSLPLHLQGKTNKNGAPVGNVSLHSSNDSGFSNDPPPQPEVDYSDDESFNGQTKMPSNRRSRNRRQESPETNDPKPPHHQRKETTNTLRQSNSAGNLVKTRHSFSDDQLSMLKQNGDKKGFVKRTKSFWRFGKSSESEILEGMAMWKHKDLVDIDDDSTIIRNNKRGNTLESTSIRKESTKATRKVSRDRSNDSERTMQANEENEGSNEHEKYTEPRRRKRSYSQNQIMSQLSKNSLQRENYKNRFDNNQNTSREGGEFYDDGDGLLLRTVNRKDILQQYSDSVGSDSVSESEETSDPYDCIIVDDQMKKVRKTTNKEKMSHVAAIGKKLEKLSKSSKYPPPSSSNNQANEENDRNVMGDVEMRNRNNTIEKTKNDRYGRNERHSFQTFGRDRENGNKDANRQTIDRRRRNNEEEDDERQVQEEERRKYYNKQQKQYNRQQSTKENRVIRSSYESINSEVDEEEEEEERISKNTRRYRSDSDNENSGDFTERSQYPESGKYIPRSKLTKTNSNNSSNQQQQQQQQRNEEESLLSYSESMKRRVNKSEDKMINNSSRHQKEKSPHGGNLYGPWYDLWGLDSSTIMRNENVHLK